MSDPYKILGVSPYASDDEITKAYKKLYRLQQSIAGKRKIQRCANYDTARKNCRRRSDT